SEQMYPPQGPRHASVDLGGVERLYPLPVPARPRFDCWGRTYPRSLATRDYHPARPDTPGYGRATSPDLQPPPTTAHLTSRIRPNAAKLVSSPLVKPLKPQPQTIAIVTT